LESSAANLLRYRFGDVAQMHAHLHVVEGRTLFFYRDGKAALAGGVRVVVQFSFSTNEQVSTLRGAVLCRVEGASAGEGGQAGLWIEFPDARLFRKIDKEGANAISARKQKRLGSDLLVEVRQGGLPLLGRMVDVSLGGARIVGAVGIRKGSEAELRLMAPEKEFPSHLGRAEVVRVDASSGDAGVRFVRTDPTARMASSKLFQGVQRAWSATPELSHSSLCCQGGLVLEPALPHMKTRI
jgi:hypothetical protein